MRNLIVFILFFLVNSLIVKGQKPNVLFCLADDWGWPHAGVYGDAGVQTPSFDRLANEGVLFNYAYVSSPSCTPSRNAFITGKYHWELGSGANLWSTLPNEHQSFIHLLADAGYVIGRTKAKTWGPGNLDDWIKHHGDHPGGPEFITFDQFVEETEAGEKPFFFWLGTHDPHRGYKLNSGKQAGIDPAKVHLFEHYPDAEPVRSDIADYYYEVQRWDTLVGRAIKKLEQMGVLDNTNIIMSGDHGMPFPRCKGNLYDSGVHVPFAIRWGNQVKGGRKVDDFISFADIAPTILDATHTPIPEDMTGSSFLKQLKADKNGVIDPKNRNLMVFGRERHVPAQEAPNMGGYPARGLRTRDFLYIRNYNEELWPAGTGDQSKTNFPGQWYADCDGGPTKNYIFDNRFKDEKHRLSFQLCFEKRPTEELFDLKKDPGQIKNVAKDKNYQSILTEMRKQMKERLTQLNDPRATDPQYSGFDQYPYLGSGGGKRKFRSN